MLLDSTKSNHCNKGYWHVSKIYSHVEQLMQSDGKISDIYLNDRSQYKAMKDKFIDKSPLCLITGIDSTGKLKLTPLKIDTGVCMHTGSSFIAAPGLGAGGTCVVKVGKYKNEVFIGKGLDRKLRDDIDLNKYKNNIFKVISDIQEYVESDIESGISDGSIIPASSKKKNKDVPPPKKGAIQLRSKVTDVTPVVRTHTKDGIEMDNPFVSFRFYGDRNTGICSASVWDNTDGNKKKIKITSKRESVDEKADIPILHIEDVIKPKTKYRAMVSMNALMYGENTISFVCAIDKINIERSIDEEGEPDMSLNEKNSEAGSDLE